MAITFIGPPPTPEHQVAHGDGNIYNNSIENLRWATPLENTHDNFANDVIMHGERNGASRLKEADVQYIKSVLSYRRFGDVARLGRMFDVEKTTIKHIRSGHTWKRVPPVYGPIQFPTGKQITINENRMDLKLMARALAVLSLRNGILSEDFYSQMWIDLGRQEHEMRQIGAMYLGRLRSAELCFREKTSTTKKALRSAKWFISEKGLAILLRLNRDEARTAFPEAA